MSRRVKQILRSVAVASCVLVLAVSCSSDGFPQSYDDQIDAETGLSNVEQNWREGCEVRYETDLATEANNVCRCAFEQIRSTIPWDAFVAMDERLDGNSSLISTANEDPSSTEHAVVQIIADCIERG